MVKVALAQISNGGVGSNFLWWLDGYVLGQVV